jgi:bifunctional non-homologous end joining protein LigD
MDVVVGGWTEGEGRRAGTIGSLVVGLWSPDGLLPVARVGSGLRDEDLSRLLRLLRSHARAESPFAMPVERDVHFVHPRLVAVVEYHQITADGHLRAPVFKGLRDDKAPEECGPGRAYRRWLDERAGGSPSPASAHH